MLVHAVLVENNDLPIKRQDTHTCRLGLEMYSPRPVGAGSMNVQRAFLDVYLCLVVLLPISFDTWRAQYVATWKRVFRWLRKTAEAD